MAQGCTPSSPPATGTSDVVAEKKLGIHFPTAPTISPDVWEVSLLFRWAPGLFAVAENANIPMGELEQSVRSSATKRFGAEKSQRHVAKTSSVFSAYAEQTKAPFIGEAALFSVMSFLTACRRRGPSVPKNVRWALKVFNEILTLALPLQHPWSIAATRTPRAIALPKPTKTAP